MRTPLHLRNFRNVKRKAEVQPLSLLLQIETLPASDLYVCISAFSSDAANFAHNLLPPLGILAVLALQGFNRQASRYDRILRTFAVNLAQNLGHSASVVRTHRPGPSSKPCLQNPSLGDLCSRSFVGFYKVLATPRMICSLSHQSVL